MGFADSSDQFLLATKSLCEGIPRVSKVMDDLLGEPSSLSEMASQLEEICSRASESGIQFSTKSVYQNQWNETACGCKKLLLNIVNTNKTLKPCIRL